MTAKPMRSRELCAPQGRTQFTRTALVAVAGFVAVGVLGACGGGGASRGDVLADVANGFALPAFEEVARDTEQLSAAVATACGSSAGSFEALTKPLEAARTAWYESEAVWTGPVMERRSPAVVDWPINEPEIVALLAEAALGELTSEMLGRSVGADNRGLGAIEWVASSPVELDGVDRGVRCDYLRGLAEVIATEADLVWRDWSESYEQGPPYAEMLAGGDAGGVDEQVDMLVNDTLGTLESMRADADAPPSAVQASRLRGLRRLYVGDDDGELDGLSPLLGGDLESRLAAELDAAIAAYESGDAAVGVAAAEDVQRTVATEVVARLGVTVGFSDADGDGGS